MHRATFNAHRATCSALHVPHRAVQHATWAVRCAADPVVDAHHFRAPGMWRTACKRRHGSRSSGPLQEVARDAVDGVLHRRGAEAVPEEAARVARPRLDVRRSHLLSLSRAQLKAARAARAYRRVRVRPMRARMAWATQVFEADDGVKGQRSSLHQPATRPVRTNLVGPTSATSAPGLGSPLSARQLDCAHPATSASATTHTAATSAAGPAHEAMPCACGCRRPALLSLGVQPPVLLILGTIGRARRRRRESWVLGRRRRGQRTTSRRLRASVRGLSSPRVPPSTLSTYPWSPRGVRAADAIPTGTGRRRAPRAKRCGDVPESGCAQRRRCGRSSERRRAAFPPQWQSAVIRVQCSNGLRQYRGSTP